ncbi:MAG: hypothetical protein QOH60_4067 [Mycobacterium sp.]|jgi:hypothetical protein|nr:hypothetical protein [Mycobacterium sp.]
MIRIPAPALFDEKSAPRSNDRGALSFSHTKVKMSPGRKRDPGSIYEQES